VGQRVNVNGVGSLLSLISHVNPLLAGDQVNQLVAVLADNHRSVVTSDVVPADAVVVFVVEDGQARLVVELLQPLDGDADVVLGVDGPVLDALEVVRLPLALLSSCAPEGLSRGGAVGRGDAGVAGAGPEPPVDDDGGEVRGVAALVLEVALPAAGVHRGDVISLHNLSEHLELSLGVKGHEVHASVPAEVTPVKPIPVLKLMPGFPPGQEVIVVTNFHV